MKRVFVVGDSISIHYGPYLEEYLQGFMSYGRKEGNEEALLNLDKPNGANGGDSSMVLDYLQQKIKLHANNDDDDGAAAADDFRNNVDVLLVNCGLHDIKIMIDRHQSSSGDDDCDRPSTIQIPLEDYKKNLTAIVDLVETSLPNTKLVWIRTTPLDETIHNSKQKNFHRHEANLKLYNQAADEIMAKRGIRSIDLYRFTNNLRYQEEYGKIFCDHVHFHSHVRRKQAAFIAGWLTSTMML